MCPLDWKECLCPRKPSSKPGFVHDDVRIYNMVCSSKPPAAAAEEEKKQYTPKAWLIDFDWCRPIDWRRPVQLTDIADGKRHVDAKVNMPMLREHDWFALASVMKMYKATKPANEARWSELCAAVAKLATQADGKLPERSQRNCFEITLKPYSDSAPGRQERPSQ